MILIGVQEDGEISRATEEKKHKKLKGLVSTSTNSEKIFEVILWVYIFLPSPLCF